MFGTCMIDRDSSLICPYKSGVGWNPFQEYDYIYLDEMFKECLEEIITRCFQSLIAVMKEVAISAQEFADAVGSIDWKPIKKNLEGIVGD